MGRSAATPDMILPEVSGLVFRVKDMTYSIDRRGGRLFHMEARGDGSDDAHPRTEAEVRYVIGSGTRGYAFLVEREGNLFQSPIAWYSQGLKWDLAPDYRMHNWHFDRVITQGCLFCHTNRFDQVGGKRPIFHGLTIGCERCHGPGELHVRRPESINGKDLTIVNPADLEPVALRENVCEQCHFQGRERSVLPGRSMFDYRPGLPLEAFLRISSGRLDPTLRHAAVGHVEQIRESRCYRDSRGKLGCISCHDPHRLPEPAARAAYYRGRCLECHVDRGCSLPRDARLTNNVQDDCSACHMPRMRTTNIAHTALTNHTIPHLSRATP
jgi:predicted CXXCH cytochrome family protein